MPYAAVAFSTIAKGRITSLDTSAAESAPGVHLVITHKNALKLKPTPIFNSSPKAAGPSDPPIMQDECIHWNGEAIAVVLGDTQEQADYAKSLIHVAYAQEPAITHFNEARQHPRELDSIMGEPPTIKIGDAEAALAAAAHRVDLTYRTPRHSHNPIELHAVTLFWDNGEFHVHDASQAVVQTAWTLAQAFDIDEEKVHVSSPTLAAASAARPCGTITFLPQQPPNSPVSPCASSSRARASTAPSVGEPLRSSVLPSERMQTVISKPLSTPVRLP